MPNTFGLWKIGTENIEDSAITTEKLADSSVTNVKLADSSVTSGKIQDGEVGTSDLADLSITTSKLADGSVNTDKLANSSVNTDKLADKACTGNKIKIDYVTWHASSIPTKSVSFSSLRNGLYLVLACCEAVYNDSTQLHKLTITTSEGDYSVDAYAYDGGGNHLIVTLFNACQVGDGTIDISWDGYHIHHIYLIWLGLP